MKLIRKEPIVRQVHCGSLQMVMKRKTGLKLNG